MYPFFKVNNELEMAQKLGSDAHWIMPDYYNWWPYDTPMFDSMNGKRRTSMNQAGVFAECENVAEVDAHHWPDVSDCDFTDTLAEINRTIQTGKAVFSGTWSPFFHVLCDLFGMGNLFTQMYENPDVVIAVSEYVVDFFLQANERLFALAGDKIDVFFFGNDFGTQLDLFISPEHFEKFLMPCFIKFTRQAQRHGYKVMLHSCGSIDRIIPRLIDVGVNALHPIQAKAANMDAENLKKYNGKIIFMGGVDTQQLLPFGTPQQVYDEVKRLINIFGTNYIVSPSHEAILSIVPPENIMAMVEAAKE